MTGSTTLTDRWENWCPQRGRSLPRLHSVEICAWRNLSAILKVLSGGTVVLLVFLFFRKSCGCRKEFLFPYIPSGLFKGKSEQVCIYLVNMICCLKPNVVYTDDNLGKRGFYPLHISGKKFFILFLSNSFYWYLQCQWANSILHATREFWKLISCS